MYFSTTDDSIELQKIQDDLTFLHTCFIEILVNAIASGLGMTG